MKNKTDGITGIITLIFCAIGVWNLTTIGDMASSTDHWGPGTYPKLILIMLFICSCTLIYQSFQAKATQPFWPAPHILKKVFTFIACFFLYIFLLVILDTWFENFGYFWLENNIAFSISTGIYLICGMYVTGRRNIIDYLSIPILVPFLIVAAFVYGFSISLP